MKTKALMFGLSTAALVAPAFATPIAATTVVDICGATAFRSASIATIRAQFVGNYQYAHDQALAASPVASVPSSLAPSGHFPESLSSASTSPVRSKASAPLPPQATTRPITRSTPKTWSLPPLQVEARPLLPL